MSHFYEGGDDVQKLEPKTQLKFEDLDKIIEELGAIYKVHPEWFEVLKLKSTKGKNKVDYFCKLNYVNL
mgnify:FL=1